MAESVRFTNIVNIVAVLVILSSVVTSYTIIPVIIPSKADVGYTILKLGCDKSDLQLRTSDVVGDFYDNFVLTDTGELVLKRPVLNKEGQHYKLTVRSPGGCYDNTPTKRTFVLHITPTPSEVFPQRLYTGVSVIGDSPGAAVPRLSNIKVRREPRQQFVLQGVYSDHFTVRSSESTNEIQIVLQKEFPAVFTKRAFSFILLSKVDGEVRGHTNIEILRVDQPHQERPVHSPSVSNHNPGSSRLTAQFDQDLSNIRDSHALRRRRQASGVVRKQTVQVNEDATGVLLQVDSGQTAGTNVQFEIISSQPEDIFLINDRGELTLKTNAKLNYDYDGIRQYVVTIEIKRQDDGTGISRHSILCHKCTNTHQRQI